MKARLAAEFALAMSARKFPDDVKAMAGYCVEWLVALGDIASYGTHKYIPQEALNAQLGLPDGAGVYGYYRFKEDGSCILLTCNHGIAVWAGQDADKAEFVE